MLLWQQVANMYLSRHLSYEDAILLLQQLLLPVARVLLQPSTPMTRREKMASSRKRQHNQNQRHHRNQRHHPNQPHHQNQPHLFTTACVVQVTSFTAISVAHQNQTVPPRPPRHHHPNPPPHLLWPLLLPLLRLWPLHGLPQVIRLLHST